MNAADNGNSLHEFRKRLQTLLAQRRFQLLALVAAVVLPVGYVVGAVPFIMCLQQLGLVNTPFGKGFIYVWYAPLIWLSENVEVWHQFFTWEREIIEWLLGS